MLRCGSLARCAGIAIIVGGVVFVVHSCFKSQKSQYDRTAVFSDAVGPLKGWMEGNTYRLRNWSSPDGWWVGDVSEIYRQGGISRELGEADTAPIRPLVDTPKPFHGSYVRAMETGPSGEQLKGKTRSKEMCAYCIYPAGADSPDQYIWLVCWYGIFRKSADRYEPVVKWPTGEWRREWSIVD